MWLLVSQIVSHMWIMGVRQNERKFFLSLKGKHMGTAFFITQKEKRPPKGPLEGCSYSTVTASRSACSSSGSSSGETTLMLR